MLASMHIAWFGDRGIFDVHGFSAGLSWVIIIGSVYGVISLVRDLVRAFVRGLPHDRPLDP